MLPFFRGEYIHSLEHVALKQSREFPAIPLVGLDPVAGFNGYERGGNNQRLDTVLYELIGEPEPERAGLVCYLHPTALVTLK